MKYTITDTDEFTRTEESELSRAELIAAIEGGDESIWGDLQGCSVERTDGDWYAAIPCDCGDEGCEEHEPSTILITVPEYDRRDWDGIQGAWYGPRLRYDGTRSNWDDLCCEGEKDQERSPGTGPWFEPHYLLSGDYTGGGLVYEANRRAWEEQFASGADVWWTNTSYGYGGRGIIVNAEQAPIAAYRFLCALEDYPCASDETLSELELEASSEAWESWARADFMRALEKRFDCEFGELPKEEPEALFRDTAERIGEYWVNEQGSDMWIDVDKVAAAVDPTDIAEWPRECEGPDRIAVAAALTGALADAVAVTAEFPVDVRLQWSGPDDWRVRWGDASFDLDHSGHWGSGEAEPGTDLAELADQLCSEVEESIAQSEE
jgi:hypothetical protein